ncbi:MAG TPA: TetR/AcrR family transcriptional regulator [Marmoricola sp.]
MAQSKSWRFGDAEVSVSLPEGLAERVREVWDTARAEVAAASGVGGGAGGGAAGGSSRRRAGRAGGRPPERPPERLSVERIVDVAIEQMRAQGYDAVTMRSIARELGTGPASLYAHVANRAELDQLVVGRVTGMLHIPDPDPARWDEQLRDTLHATLALYRAHPGVARATLGMIPMEPGVLMVSERLLGLLRAGGVPDQYAAWSVDVLSLLVASVAVEEDIWRQRGGGASEEAVVAEVRTVFARLPAEHFPLLSSMADVLTAGDGDERFDFAVTLLVEGLKAVSRAG